MIVPRTRKGSEIQQTRSQVNKTSCFWGLERTRKTSGYVLGKFDQPWSQVGPRQIRV